MSTNDRVNSNSTVCRGCAKWKNLTIGPNGLCTQCHYDLEAFWASGEERINDIGRNGNDGLHYPSEPVTKATAASILINARSHLTARADTYDTEGGERSMAKTIAIFNAARGRDLTEAEGWLFMVCLKMARATQPGYNPDDYEDMSAYSALLGECAGRG